jgi:MFS family permease
MLACLLATFAQGALAAVVFTWLPSYYEDGLGISPSLSGVLFALPSVAGVIALIGIGEVGDRLMRRGAPMRVSRGLAGGACLLLAGISLMLLTWVSSSVVAVTLVVLGYGLSVTVNTVTYPVVPELFPASRRAGALAMVTAASAAAGVLSPLVVGLLVDGAASPGKGYTTSFLVFGGVLALGGLLFGWLVDPDRDAAKS